MGIQTSVCNILSSDIFYSDEPGDLLKWVKMGVVAVDMETAGLYLNAARCGKNALSLLTVSDNIVTREELTPEAREKSFNDMFLLALSLI